MIKISKISKSYGKVTIVDNLSLSIQNGVVFGFLGPNGAGKTTTIKMLVGLNKPDSGKIEIEKKDPCMPKTREMLGFMPENPYFYDRLTGLEMLKFCYELCWSSPTRSGIHKKNKVDSRFHGNDKRNKNNHNYSSRTKDENSDDSNSPYRIGKSNDIFNKILADVGLSDAKNKTIRYYSKGMKQRLGLAQALVSDPKYLFLDEPLDGLDPIGRIEVKKIILDLKKRGKTIFFNSHILADVEEICDQIGIINNGRLIYSGNIQKFCKNKPFEAKFVEAIEIDNAKFKTQSSK